MTINFKTPEINRAKPRILVLGVGGAGGNDKQNDRKWITRR